MVKLSSVLYCSINVHFDNYDFHKFSCLDQGGLNKPNIILILYDLHLFMVAQVTMLLNTIQLHLITSRPSIAKW